MWVYLSIPNLCIFSSNHICLPSFLNTPQRRPTIEYTLYFTHSTQHSGYKVLWMNDTRLLLTNLKSHIIGGYENVLQSQWSNKLGPLLCLLFFFIFLDVQSYPASWGNIEHQSLFFYLQRVTAAKVYLK